MIAKTVNLLCGIIGNRIPQSKFTKNMLNCRVARRTTRLVRFDFFYASTLNGEGKHHEVSAIMLKLKDMMSTSSSL